MAWKGESVVGNRWGYRKKLLDAVVKNLFLKAVERVGNIRTGNVKIIYP